MYQQRGTFQFPHAAGTGTLSSSPLPNRTQKLFSFRVRHRTETFQFPGSVDGSIRRLFASALLQHAPTYASLKQALCREDGTTWDGSPAAAQLRVFHKRGGGYARQRNWISSFKGYPPRSGEASPQGWGRTRTLVNSTVCGPYPRSCGASLEGGRATKPCKYYDFGIPSSLRREPWSS